MVYSIELIDYTNGYTTKIQVIGEIRDSDLTDYMKSHLIFNKDGVLKELFFYTVVNQDTEEETVHSLEIKISSNKIDNIPAVEISEFIKLYERYYKF